jgi:hypothetical protein
MKKVNLKMSSKIKNNTIYLILIDKYAFEYLLKIVEEHIFS